MAKYCCVPEANPYLSSLPFQKVVFCLLQEYQKNIFLDAKMRLALLTILPLPSLLLTTPFPTSFPQPDCPTSCPSTGACTLHITFMVRDKSVKWPQYFLCMFTSNIQTSCRKIIKQHSENKWEKKGGFRDAVHFFTFLRTMKALFHF